MFAVLAVFVKEASGYHPNNFSGSPFCGTGEIALGGHDGECDWYHGEQVVNVSNSSLPRYRECGYWCGGPNDNNRILPDGKFGICSTWHLEYRGSGSCVNYTCIGNTITCKTINNSNDCQSGNDAGFYYPPIFYDNSNPSGTSSWSIYGVNFANVIPTGSATVNVPSSSSSGTTGDGWNTNCVLSASTSTGLEGMHCSDADLKMTSDAKAGGNAIKGFFVRYNKSSLKIDCTGCVAGWKLTGSSPERKCNACNTAGHFVHPTGSTTVCSCAYGYTRQGDTCVHPDGSYFYCTGNSANTCVCPSGFENITPRSGTCGNVSGGPCKQNFRFDGGTNSCVCDEPYYTWDKGDPNDPEDDECNVNNGAIYKDNTGLFKLGDVSCGEMPWWL